MKKKSAEAKKDHKDLNSQFSKQKTRIDKLIKQNMSLSKSVEVKEKKITDLNSKVAIHTEKYKLVKATCEYEKKELKKQFDMGIKLMETEIQYEKKDLKKQYDLDIKMTNVEIQKGKDTLKSKSTTHESELKNKDNRITELEAQLKISDTKIKELEKDEQQIKKSILDKSKKYDKMIVEKDRTKMLTAKMASDD